MEGSSFNCWFSTQTITCQPTANLTNCWYGLKITCPLPFGRPSTNFITLLFLSSFRFTYLFCLQFISSNFLSLINLKCLLAGMSNAIFMELWHNLIGPIIFTIFFWNHLSFIFCILLIFSRRTVYGLRWPLVETPLGSLRWLFLFNFLFWLFYWSWLFLGSCLHIPRSNWSIINRLDLCFLSLKLFFCFLFIH